MSLSLGVRAIPTTPPNLNDCWVDDGYLLEALNLGDPFAQTTKSSLMHQPAPIRRGSAAHQFLRGVLAGWARDPDNRANDSGEEVGLRNLLEAIDRLGGVEVWAS